jgi:hypothetical protein
MPPPPHPPDATLSFDAVRNTVPVGLSHPSHLTQLCSQPFRCVDPYVCPSPSFPLIGRHDALAPHPNAPCVICRPLPLLHLSLLPPSGPTATPLPITGRPVPCTGDLQPPGAGWWPWLSLASRLSPAGQRPRLRAVARPHEPAPQSTAWSSPRLPFASAHTAHLCVPRDCAHPFVDTAPPSAQGPPGCGSPRRPRRPGRLTCHCRIIGLVLPPPFGCWC